MQRCDGKAFSQVACSSAPCCHHARMPCMCQTMLPTSCSDYLLRSRIDTRRILPRHVGLPAKSADASAQCRCRKIFAEAFRRWCIQSALVEACARDCISAFGVSTCFSWLRCRDSRLELPLRMRPRGLNGLAQRLPHDGRSEVGGIFAAAACLAWCIQDDICVSLRRPCFTSAVQSPLR